jgi:predicted RNA-binding Zn ribbon-like protein
LPYRVVVLRTARDQLRDAPPILQGYVDGILAVLRVDPRAATAAFEVRQVDDDYREAIWRCADARVEGRQPSRGEVGEVNRAAARPPLTPRIDGSGRRAWATPVTPGQALSVVARDAVDLFGGPLARRIRRCAGERCTLVFVDASRAGRRRWCSMDRCGNRAKVRAFRDRRRQRQEEEAP